jgi:hypothetical protein
LKLGAICSGPDRLPCHQNHHKERRLINVQGVIDVFYYLYIRAIRFGRFLDSPSHIRLSGRNTWKPELRALSVGNSLSNAVYDEWILLGKKQ